MRKSEKEIAKELYSMKLMDHLPIILYPDEFYEVEDYVKRVPGGWIFYNEERGVFVPYSDEFNHEKAHQ